MECSPGAFFVAAPRHAAGLPRFLPTDSLLTTATFVILMVYLIMPVTSISSGYGDSNGLTCRN